MYIYIKSQTALIITNYIVIVDSYVYCYIIILKIYKQEKNFQVEMLDEFI